MKINIDDLYRRYGPMVFRRCRQLLGDEAEAKDAMQDTFVNLIRAEESLEAEFPSSLLYRMATNVSLNRMRTRRRHPENRDEELLHSIASSEDVESGALVGRFLESLFGTTGESSRVMAVLHYVDGLTLEEVAEECKMSVSGVRKRLRKIRETALALQAKDTQEVAA